MKTKTFKLSVVIGLMLFSCTAKKDQTQIQAELTSLNLIRGDIALCGSGEDEFGTVGFGLACSEAVRKDFNLATAMLHSFEYTEAEKVFAKVIENDPECVMAYWGAAMCNFHPLWAPPGESDLEKGTRIVGLGRSMVDDKSSRESGYLEAIATIYDDWKTLDHKTRVLKFEKACQSLYEKYPDDTEAAVFYALALDASADPADKTFRNQKKAGDILNAIFTTYPDHPGIAHYIIHNYDYPELAEQGLAAARKYAAIATASAHAQHMPSHIFTRLGLWDESIQSNIKSVDAARCYAENLGIKGHWGQELHGLDYLMYAYLQKGNELDALKQLDYVMMIKDVSPMDFAGAYSFGAIPARYAVERKDWQAAAKLEHAPADFPWDKFPWESANINFARLLGAVHTGNLELAKQDLKQLEVLNEQLQKTNEYQSNLVLIQIKASQAWIMFAEGKKSEAIARMTEAADMEDATAKHPVTPGEIVPARELLGDMYMKMGDAGSALKAYEEDLERHAGRFNGLYGAGLAAEKSGEHEKAASYYKQLLDLASGSDRVEIQEARSYLKKRGVVI